MFYYILHPLNPTSDDVVMAVVQKVLIFYTLVKAKIPSESSTCYCIKVLSKLLDGFWKHMDVYEPSLIIPAQHFQPLEEDIFHGFSHRCWHLYSTEKVSLTLYLLFKTNRKRERKKKTERERLTEARLSGQLWEDEWSWGDDRGIPPIQVHSLPKLWPLLSHLPSDSGFPQQRFIYFYLF